MNKKEFLEFLVYLRKLFPKADIPSDDIEIAEAWYEGFRKIGIVEAKRMANLYFQDEKGNFNYARLMQYKSNATIRLRGWD